jgi:hypothetical protein
VGRFACDWHRLSTTDLMHRQPRRIISQAQKKIKHVFSETPREEKKDPAMPGKKAEMWGFEPQHGQSPPTGFRIRTLQPLGYISMPK